jgi:signal transduction histidine kinase/ligand-binding sensor domain-containing protein/DNA-binding response OmpR family regulator
MAKVTSPDFTGSFIRSVQFDRYGHLWIGTTNGLFLFSPEKNTIEAISVPSRNDQSKEVFEIFEDDDGLLWIGTYSNGLFIADPASGRLEHVNLGPYYERTETIRAISKGILGEYWIGTRGGLYTYSKTKGVTGFFRHDDRDNKSLANNSVLEIFHDVRGETWIGTRGGLNLLAKSKQVFKNYSALPNDKHYLNSSIIYAFWIDEKERIWAGTEDGGINIVDPETGIFEYLTSQPDNPNTISQNCVKALLPDNKGNLWIGTFWGGIDVMNLKTGTMTHYKHSADDNGSLSDNRVWAFCKGLNGGMWVGTSAGIDLFNPVNGKFTHFPQLVRDKQVNWISYDSDNNLWIGTTDEVVIYDQDNEAIVHFSEHNRSFLEDSRGQCWIATLDRGIALYSKSMGAVKYFNESDGLANYQALSILEDNNKNLWISTSNGLSRFDPEKLQFRNFTGRDGLRNNQFTYGAAYKAQNGELLFGGISGFNMFNPEDILDEDLNVPLVFTELRIFNRPVAPSDDPKAVLQKSISETSHLVLDYDQNVITLQFAALDFVNSNSNLYSYFLEGFDKEWSEPGSSRSVTYTNLYPDEYVLRVRKIFPGNSSEGDDLILNITVLPPFWLTWWFRTFILITIAGLLYLLIQFILNREKIRNELVAERTKARDLHEIDMLKLRLFTNISHEIRTPLTLILSPLEKLIAEKVPEEEIPAHLSLVYRNTKQLDRLINQLLDFRKLETGNLKLELTTGDMVILVSDTVRSFEEYAKEKQITLKFHSLKKRINALFDAEKVETILNNLLSNALKYTGEGGTVSVHLSLVFASDEEESLSFGPEKQLIEISVKDTGEGISGNNIEKVFTRFFRVNSENESSGTGIGLSLVKELVNLHKGTVYVQSKSGKGSKFTVRLPFETESAIEDVDSADDAVNKIQKSGKIKVSGSDLSEKADARIMLIVEDNPDVRYFIRSHFESVYSVYEAKNGKEGWELATMIIPDVIISDILMPDVDGFEFCKRIKKDERTSHIPLLLLTALHSREHEIEGLSCGADDYVTKPFDISVLQTKIENMLSVRHALREKYTRELILKPSDITVSSPDDRFLQKAMAVVEKNISNPDFDIEHFAAEAGVSRMQLYRKFNALTNMTVKEFVRSIRLKRSAQLLMEKKMNITEIAFSVGFKDLSHFRKCFHREYGMSASEYINQNIRASEN